MKKLGISVAILLVGILVFGLWWITRRKPSTEPLTENSASVIKVERVGPGTVLRYEDPQVPLRALRWLPPQANGIMVLQVATQSDRQEISLFKNGQFQATYLVPKPTGVRDGFFRLAELREAQIVEGDVAVLLYAAQGTSDGELPLVLALDLNTKDIRWIHRALGEHLVLSDPQEALVYLFGPKSAPVKLPLAVASGEKTSPAGARSSAKAIELPPDVLDIDDLKPTGAWTFLLAHKGGLSAYLGSKGWQHHPMPEGNPGLFKDVKGVLGGEAKKYWWQPFPGWVAQVQLDGSVRSLWTSDQLAAADPFSKDAELLHLLGADGEGRLWFDLAVPASPSPSASGSASETQPENSPADTQVIPGTDEPATVKLEDWPTYVNQGLDRIYRWDPQKKTMERFKWASLNAPQGFKKPLNSVKLLPNSGFLFQENGPAAWLIPLASLAFGEPANTGKPIQAK